MSVFFSNLVSAQRNETIHKNVVNNAENRNSLKNISSKIYKSPKRKEWNKNHVLHWEKSLELNNSGFSIFQNELHDKLEQVLTGYTISYVTEIRDYYDSDYEDGTVKMIILTLDESSKFWIYHAHADLTIHNKSQNYEKWGYLKPEELINEYLKSTVELLELKNIRN